MGSWSLKLEAIQEIRYFLHFQLKMKAAQTLPLEEKGTYASGRSPAIRRLSDESELPRALFARLSALHRATPAVTFYTLLGEAFLLSAGIDFTIVRCGSTSCLELRGPSHF